MGQQVNYFGGREALESILNCLAEARPLIFPVRTSSKDIKPVHRSEIMPFAEYDRDTFVSFAIVSPVRVDELAWQPTPQGGYQMDLRCSPALELTPAIIIDGGVAARQGRVYLASRDQQLLSHLQRLRTLVTKTCKPIVYGHRYWLFPEAERVQYLHGFVGKPIKNPFVHNS